MFMLRLGLATAILLAAKPESAPPVDLGVTEETGTSLAQIEVTLTGPPEALVKVDARSFALALGMHDVEQLLVDGSCAAPEAVDAPPAPSLPRRPTTWMLYFDQPHLTVTGRIRALEMARQVLPRLFLPGDRVTVVANGVRLVTAQPLTSDLASTLATLARLKLDFTQLDPRLLAQESNADLMRRVANTKGAGPSTSMALFGMSRSMALEEEWVLRRDWTRLKLALRRLADVEPSRAMIYFADTIYRSFGEAVEFEFERVVREAAAQGIRVYTMEPIMLGTGNAAAQKTLQSRASQTGGQAFVRGATADRVVHAILKDQGCRWLLSFDPEGLPLDKPMEVFVRVTVPHVRVHAPAKFEIQSPKRRAMARLMAQFSLDDRTPSTLRSGLVPLAWKNGRYTALLQVTAPAMDLPSVTWDLGASLVETGRVGAETSGRTRVGGKGIPVTLEAMVELKPGAFEVAAVAREVTTDLAISYHTEGTWPEPNATFAVVVPPVVLQPGAGAFTRDGKTRKSGSLLRGMDDPLDRSRPTAMVALICRRGEVRTALNVTRVLEGASPVEFPALALDLRDERCGQVRDMIPARTLGPGRYQYRILVREKGAVIGTGETSFVVPES
ncbi:MAG TPA: hypothetical protein VFO11_11510 [Candidatus Polarisedimenticolaceae bacterium]|nr:hypothetical protein [Candidatus Polarisedimenticolaceae bacterium]